MVRVNASDLNQPFNPTALLVIYGALTSACFVSMGVCAFLALGIELKVDLPPDLGPVLKLALLGLGVTQLVAGVAVATLNVSPAGWERHPLEGWQPAPQRLKGNDQPDTADRFGMRGFQRIVVGGALIEAVAIFGIVQVIVGNGLAVGAGMGAVALAVMLVAILPRVLYVNKTVEELRAIEAAGEGASEEA